MHQYKWFLIVLKMKAKRQQIMTIAKKIKKFQLGTQHQFSIFLLKRKSRKLVFH